MIHDSKMWHTANLKPPRKMTAEEKLQCIRRIIHDYQKHTLDGIDEMMVEIDEVLDDKVELAEVLHPQNDLCDCAKKEVVV